MVGAIGVDVTGNADRRCRALETERFDSIVNYLSAQPVTIVLHSCHPGVSLLLIAEFLVCERPMQTASEPRVTEPRKLVGRRYDKVFFGCMVVLLLLVVFVGFARSYYLAGVFRAP